MSSNITDNAFVNPYARTSTTATATAPGKRQQPVDLLNGSEPKRLNTGTVVDVAITSPTTPTVVANVTITSPTTTPTVPTVPAVAAVAAAAAAAVPLPREVMGRVTLGTLHLHDIATASPYKLRRTYDDSDTSSEDTTHSMISNNTSTTTVLASPSRKPEHDKPTCEFPYGSPCVGCGKTFCPHMRALQTVNGQAMKYFKSGVHKQHELVQKNYLRRNFFYKLYKNHIGLSSVKKSPYCVIKRAKEWFPEQYEIDIAALLHWQN